MAPSYVVYFGPGACSRVTLSALEHAGLAYEARPVQLAQGEQHQAAFLALNPKGKVPLLITTEGSLTETVAIALFLHQRHPHAALLTSEGIFAEAVAQSWLAWCATTLHPLIYRLRMTGRIHPDVQTHAVLRATALQELDTYLLLVERHLADGRHWLCGSAWCLADSYLLWVLQRAAQSGYPLAADTALAAWALRCSEFPAWTRAVERESDTPKQQ